jgi:hypothetical protein
MDDMFPLVPIAWKFIAEPGPAGHRILVFPGFSNGKKNLTQHGIPEPVSTKEP